MNLCLESACVLVFVCVAQVLSAPAKKSSGPGQQLSSPTIQQQEKELERLANIAAQRLTHSMGLQKQKSFHYSNINGKEKSDSATEEKVVNPETGDLVSDIKQETKQKEDGTPIMKTKIAIPSENVDETFVEKPDAINRVPLQKSDYSEAFRYTPIEVAKYLYQTGNFEELNKALKDLVNASIMTEKQAVQYKDDVRAAYNQLVQSSIYADSNDLPVYETNDNVIPSDVMSGYGYYNELPPYGRDETQNVIPESEESNGLSDLVNTLMDEWLTRTVLTGDRDAETMLSAIWDSVSQDENPDDLGQMREILVDIFTSEIIEGLSADVNNEVPYYSTLLTNNANDKQVKIEDNSKQTEPKEINGKTVNEAELKNVENNKAEKPETKTEEDLKHLKM